MKGRLRYLGTFFIICVIPAAIFAARLSWFKISLIFGIFLLSAIFFVLVDIALTKSKHVSKWAYKFNPRSILGWWIFGLPFEEYVFILTTIFLPITFWEFIKFLSLDTGFTILIGIFAILLLSVVSPILHKLDD